MCCGEARGHNLPHPETASFKKSLLHLRNYTFSKKDHVAILKQFQNPPSGCRKCLWANSGDLFPDRARDRSIFNIFMAGADLSSWPFPEVSKRIMLACRSNLSFFIFDTFDSRIVPLQKENNISSRIYPDLDPRSGAKCSVLNIILRTIFGVAPSKSHIKT